MKFQNGKQKFLIKIIFVGKNKAAISEKVVIKCPGTRKEQMGGDQGSGGVYGGRSDGHCANSIHRSGSHY